MLLVFSLLAKEHIIRVAGVWCAARCEQREREWTVPLGDRLSGALRIATIK
jgi:hypothetical protein